MPSHLITAVALAAALALPFAATDALAAQTGAASQPAAAQAATPAVAAKKPAAKKPVAAKKPAAKKTIVAKKTHPVKRKGKAPVKEVKVKAAPPPPAAEHLTAAELTMAKEIYTGTIPCELGASVTVTADQKTPGFFTVALGKYHYTMHPVPSRTGVIRMEDDHADAVWLQLGSKSMLMNQKLGQRMADECATPVQRQYAAELRAHPRSLFDVPPKQ